MTQPRNVDALPDTQTPTTSGLAAAVKRARNFMRTDEGSNSDLDRIPQLAWLLFLKAFDALEQNREVTDARYRPAISEPYRWRDWAASTQNGRTGPELIKFVNDDLLPYLRGLRGDDVADPRDVLAAVFKETFNRMLSGYLLREVIDEIDKVNFSSAEDIHTMAALYESMLRDVRDAAGASGEFYTPRPVIRFIVQQVDPKPGESVLDPACGTAGFLVEAREHLAPGLKTASQFRALDEHLRGIEKKPLPFLLANMNMVLHGAQQPAIRRGNALSQQLTQIHKSQRVDVVLTNPPFGGEEEASIQRNFPSATRTAETAWLFLQLVVRQLKENGRCGIVLPNTVLFAVDGAGALIKKQLLAETNLHTIVRLPEGVFSPYTDIPTNLLFLEKTGRTREVWYYEMPQPDGRKKYTKTKPLNFADFADCAAWWGGAERLGRVENERAWRVPIADIEARSFDLDLHNPAATGDVHAQSPADVVADMLKVEEEMLAVLRRLHFVLPT
jgi:type I restriction enzyme M protein